MIATKRWIGDSVPVAQIDTLTPGGTIEVGDIFTATINGKSISVVSADTTVAAVVTLLTAAWNTSTIPEFAEATAVDSTTAVTLTADTAGKPFIVTASETDGGVADTQTHTQATTTASAGPNHWDTAANYDGDSVPTGSDIVYIDTGSVDILYGLAQSGVTLQQLIIDQGYTGTIGLPVLNTDASGAANTYGEYRATYLAISASDTEIGGGRGNGSGRIKIDFGSNAATTNVINSGQAAETGIPAILFLGTHANNILNVFKGSVGVAYFPGEVSTIATLSVGWKTSQAADSDVRLGDGMTLTNIDQSGGLLEIEDNTTTIDMTGGTLTILGTATAADIDLDGATVYYQSSGTLTTVRVGGGGVLDFTRDMRARTVTNVEAHANSSIRDPFKTVTWTNGIDLIRCELPKPGASSAQVRELDLGKHVTLTPSAV